jgi:hypothetical protein
MRVQHLLQYVFLDNGTKFQPFVTVCTYQECTVPRGERHDVGARDDAGADGLDVGLDLVDDLESANGVDVGTGALLADEATHVVQKNRAVAALYIEKQLKEPYFHKTVSDQVLMKNGYYLDKAVMEEQPDEGCAHPSLRE